jgi:sirohydrochlorin cobaltochelatase
VDPDVRAGHPATASRQPHPATAVLLVAHGSRSPEGQQEMLAFGRLLAAAAPEVPVATGFLELCQPPADQALDDLVAAGATQVAVLPLMLAPADHTKSDVPAVVLLGRRRHPTVQLLPARPLGTDLAVLATAAARLHEAGATGLPLCLVARGTSDPEANAEAYRAARLLAEANRSRLVEVGFAGVTWPTTTEALERLVAQGAREIVCLAWFLSTGLLVQRIWQDCAAFSRARGLPVRAAGHLGPDPRLGPLLRDRLEEALAGRATMTCDVCAYRAPFPGLEDRLGHPLGVGRSHLAATHRHHHHP